MPSLVAVARRPARAILTLLSMTMAFLLVGMMLGFNGFFQRLEEIARANCIYVGARFDGATTVAVGARTAMPEVTDITGYAVMPGYHQEVRNRVFVIMADEHTLSGAHRAGDTSAVGCIAPHPHRRDPQSGARHIPEQEDR